MGDECGSEYGGIDDAREEVEMTRAEERIEQNVRRNAVNLKNKTDKELDDMLEKILNNIKKGNTKKIDRVIMVLSKYEILDEIIRREKDNG